MATTTTSTTKRSYTGLYQFKEKDPVIDIIYNMTVLEAKVRAVSLRTIITDICTDTGIHERTLYMWFSGPTKFPRFAFVQRVAMALGYEFEPISKKQRHNKTH